MPEIFEDRMPLAIMEPDHSAVLDLLSDRNIGKIRAKETVHFCGLAHVSPTQSVFFLPRNLRTHDIKRDLETARLTMRTMARYGRDIRSRVGITPEEGDRSALIAVVESIADDYRRYGIYSERSRYRSRGSGKPDWKRTISRETPFFTDEGVAVYPDIRTSRSLDSRDNPLSRIQAAVLREISAAHGWWLEGMSGAKRDLLDFDPPLVPRALWKHRLRALLPTIYAARAISLIKSMISYLDETSDETRGSFLSGVEDFERVWEEMLRKTLDGVESIDWNARLPQPAYVDEHGIARTIGSGMEMDIVVRREGSEADHLHILDAKYYAATGTGSVPKTGDIVKQLMYELAMKAAIEDRGSAETVSGGFIFPSGGRHARRFVEAGFKGGQTPDYRFPTIKIYYADIAQVMEAYAGRTKFEMKLDAGD